MKTNRYLIIFGIVAFVLLIPLIAMQFTSEVNWDLLDFAVAGVLLLSTALLINFVARKLRQNKYRTVIIACIVLLLILVWMELGVGIFGTPFAGN